MKIQKDRLTERQRLFCEMYIGPGRHCAALAARLAGYAPGCSHVTGCQLLKKPKIAATVRGLEDALALDMNMTKRHLIAEMARTVELAKSLSQPSSMIAGLRQIALMSGYYRQEEVLPAKARDGGEVLHRLNQLSDKELENLIMAGA
jgi:phage terminase small subunit